MKLVLAIDPSGNFTEGKGTTGWAVVSTDKKVISCGQILAEHYETKFDYWRAVLNIIKFTKFDYIVVEDFLLYKDKSQSQINSRFETPKLIGIIELLCNDLGIKCNLQRAVDVKTRWKDDILVFKNWIQRNGNKYYAGGVLISEHIRDAIRHGVHFVTFKVEENYE
jgi:hypothetical protein